MSRATETLVVFTCLAVLSVLSWFVVRQIAEYSSSLESQVAQAPPLVIDTAPPPLVVSEQPAQVSIPQTPPASPAGQPQSIVEGLRAHNGARSYAEPSEKSAMNNFLWGVYPYLCIVLFFAVPLIRMVFRPFSWSTRASGLFGRKLLGAASLLLHWGLALVLLGHLTGLIGGVLGSQGAVTFFYWSGLLGGSMVLVGSVIALYRRLTTPEVRAMSQVDDFVVHLFIIPIVGLALYQVLVHRIFGVAFGASTWAASLWTLSPQPELMASASLITKLHILLALTFFAYFPFTKLVHFWTFPINYFVRPYLSMRTQRYRFQRRWEFAWRSDKSWLTYGLGSVAVIFLVAAMLLGRTQPSEASGIALTSTALETNNGSLLTGYALYVSQCARCHGVHGRGDGSGANSPTFSAPPRDLIAARYHFVSTENGIASDDDLYRTIYRGLSNTGMPAFADLTNGQIVSLIDVLNDFRADGSKPGRPIAVGPPPPATEQSIARGQALYVEACANCHGAEGRGDGESLSFDYLQQRVVPADLRAGDIKSGDDPEQIYLRITTGIPGGYEGAYIMLNFGQLSEADRWALVHYLKTQIMPASDESE